jgi:hypothetical protein
MTKLGRRTVLRGAGGVALALPWLEAMGLPGRGTARAASLTGFPKRFMVFFSPNGTVKDQWVPTGDANSWTLSPILKPLEPYKEHVVVLDGIRNEASYHGPGDGHQTGMGCMLTAIELLPGTTKGGCATCAPAGYASGPSVDQVIVQKSPTKTKFPSLELGVNAGARGTQWGYSNYQASNMPLPLENSPTRVFQRVFTDFQGGGGADPTALARLRAERKSLLDAVTNHYQSLSAKLGQSDRQRLQSHLQGVRELEMRLGAASTGPAAGSAGCAKPATPSTSTDPQIVGDLQADLLVTAMACDLTRVGTIQWENSVGNMRFSWLGATRSHHDLSHDPDTNAESKAMLTKINIYLSERLAYIARKLKSIPEGPGTMLDNTCILWCNELNRGNAHDRAAMPFVLVGKAGGALRTNRFMRFTRTNHGNLFVSLLNMYDIPATTFGNPAYCTGALSGL